jgi:ABC-type branched-subunit amino acid transport system substrate-binding protein
MVRGPGAPGRAGSGRVVILVPLSGSLGNLGRPMVQAAQLALPPGSGPTLDSKDTGGTPEGAAAAARAAIAEGAGIILGPLTSAETAAVAPIARAAGVPVLAFTNNAAQAQPGVWTLGITPAQQVRRLVAAAQAQNKTQFAALVPDTDFGRALADALAEACTSAGLAVPAVRLHGSGMGAISAAARDISNYAGRRGPVEARMKAARSQLTAEGRREAAQLARSSVPPPPFNALLLGAVRDDLQLLASVLPYYDVDRSQVQFLGPALWAASGSGGGAMQGAWYAAPDGAARAPLEQAYSAKYGGPAPPLADLAFDAASIARVLASQGGFTTAGLTQPAGFMGVDGWLALLPDGHVRRGLAVYRIERGGPTIIEPAPQSSSIPGT